LLHLQQGHSDGDFADTTFSSDVADLVCAADHLREHYRAPALLMGHSLGGAAVLAAVSEIPEVLAVATIAAPSSPDHLTHLLAEVRPEIEAAGEAEVTLAGRTFRIRRQFLDDIATQPQRERIAALRRPLLLLHSPQDEQVGVDNATAIFEAAHHPKSFVALDGADHLLSRAADAEYAADVIAAWAGRFLAAEPQRPTPRPTQWQAPRIPMPSS
jgi:putative redox protein